MPIYRTKNDNFFKKWTPQMAYVLGFFTADGSMYKTRRGTHFIEFQITDKELLMEIKKLLGSSHKITLRRGRNKHQKNIYRLQIGSKEIFRDLLKLGLVPKKSKIIKLPTVPDKFFRDFLRGYFDGDGNVWSGYVHKERNKPTATMSAGFTSGSREFTLSLRNVLRDIGNLVGGTLQYHDHAYRLRYSTVNSIKLYNLMYSDDNVLCLPRKKRIFESFLAKRGPVV